VRSSVVSTDELKVHGRRPSISKETRVYAIGDIHGRLDLLKQLLSLCAADAAQNPIQRPIYVFLGDYIDRGQWSRETIDRLIDHAATHESVFLKGNHELIAISCLTDRSKMDEWLRLGGRETLTSYGVAPRLIADRNKIAETQMAFHNALPRSHFQFFRDLRRSFTCGDFYFAHAGVRPGVELTKQKEEDLFWIRSAFLESSHDFGKIIVHGHTPTKEVEIRSNRINLDTGAFATGILTCLVIEGGSLSVIDTSRDCSANV
jgi:diadenosine tetraphosphatase ApaH/serine/threonine PP2A family protein phosphatase